jgi:hypothetical protein
LPPTVNLFPPGLNVKDKKKKLGQDGQGGTTEPHTMMFAFLSTSIRDLFSHPKP